MGRVTIGERPTRETTRGERPVIQRKRIDRTAPDFDSLFDADENPLDLLPEYDGDFQASADHEMTAVEREIEANLAASAERFRIGADEGYYCVLCFQTTEQKEEFLQKTGWITSGDKYINGLEVAEMLGVELAFIPMAPRKMRVGVRKFAGEEVIDHA